ncbi:MAG: Holo-(acyl-carrier-protein) synthase [Candidatus Omnitrophica bacterium ADurb.Bin292]|nr:MAG: Holo-(acyl-carrier-protein) synthase [Candidatus Omnitrophica bacterium ADurb.Bin292]HPW76409.1 holo-ACP synthase [Candidatus Omnitrophota bacterium]HQB11667.1 holo-ACP synthase [Candidatus Omnitrophota bacterium]
MKILQGIDLVKISRMEAAIKRGGKRFLERVFSKAERKYCSGKRMMFEHYAARFAAKEALIKATGIRLKKGQRLAEIEVRHEKTGKPFLSLTTAMRRAARLDARDRVELSIAHEREYAIANVVIVKPR